ncbi:hypothetical protein BDF14DRAFT_1846837 [Spinellus fusiger]|nr:hypothetical protein BDF14DRAFT_1846837 [Spinellus fusiger]
MTIIANTFFWLARAVDSQLLYHLAGMCCSAPAMSPTLVLLFSSCHTGWFPKFGIFLLAPVLSLLSHLVLTQDLPPLHLAMLLVFLAALFAALLLWTHQVFGYLLPDDNPLALVRDQIQVLMVVVLLVLV